MLLTAAGIVYLAYALFRAYLTDHVVPGWTSVVVLQCIFFGAFLAARGPIGDYFARIYDEAKDRPRCVVGEVRSFSSVPHGERAVVLRHRNGERAGRRRESGPMQNQG